MLIVSPVDALTTFGPVTNMSEFSRVMMIRSVNAGQYTAPPAHGPRMMEICGTKPLASQVFLKIRPYWLSAATPSWIRAPPESINATIGTLRLMAISMRWQIFSPSATPSVPPRTEKSCAYTATVRP